MEARDADGYVFRTDLRLRPDPAATPPAVALPARLAYYESMGQNWERAAMIKARPVAGDLALGGRFLRAIRPFVWRRGLDFAAIADIHAMKRRINAHKGGALADGRDPWRASPATTQARAKAASARSSSPRRRCSWSGAGATRRCATRRRSARCDAWPGPASCRRRAAAELAVAYRLLRTVEHRLQMVADRQTHALPDKRRRS